METKLTDDRGWVEFKDISIPTTYHLEVSSKEGLTFKNEKIECQF